MGCLDITWREFISQCKDLVFCPPYLWGKIDSQLLLWMGKCRHHLILQDLIWIKIFGWNYLQTETCDYFNQSICSFYQLYFNWNNYSNKLINWLFSTITKSLLKHLLSDHGPVASQCSNYITSGFVTSWMWCIATVVCCSWKVSPSATNRQDDLGKYTSSREQYTNCGKLMNILFWNFEPSSRMSLRVYINFVTIFCSHF